EHAFGRANTYQRNRVRLSCTTGMLLCLDREQRLAYIRSGRTRARVTPTGAQAIYSNRFKVHVNEQGENTMATMTHPDTRSNVSIETRCSGKVLRSTTTHCARS